MALNYFNFSLAQNRSVFFDGKYAKSIEKNRLKISQKIASIMTGKECDARFLEFNVGSEKSLTLTLP